MFSLFWQTKAHYFLKLHTCSYHLIIRYSEFCSQGKLNSHCEFTFTSAFTLSYEDITLHDEDNTSHNEDNTLEDKNTPMQNEDSTLKLCHKESGCYANLPIAREKCHVEKWQLDLSLAPFLFKRSLQAHGFAFRYWEYNLKWK